MKKNLQELREVFSQNKQMKKIYDLRLKDKQETIALQPGKYRIVYRSKNARTIHTTVDKEFEIVSSGSSSLKLWGHKSTSLLWEFVRKGVKK